MSKICRIVEGMSRGSWRAIEVDRDMARKGIQIMREILAKDDRKQREGPSGLPLDGRNRIYRIY